MAIVKISEDEKKIHPSYVKAFVTGCREVEGASPKGSVHSLSVEARGADGLGRSPSMPEPGQFYMLRATKGDVLLGRPISVFDARETDGGVALQFLILEKGRGTELLCSLEKGDEVFILGPLGVPFPRAEAGRKVCVVGGGIGVAPVAFLARSLPEKSFDFFASFKSGAYGLAGLKSAATAITTEDGSVGKRGMLPAALTADVLRENKYSCVCACGPDAMLAYVKKISEEAGVRCYLSMERRMACGVGVCLGCSVRTTEGNKRCCKDGPVFDSRLVEFPKPVSRAPAAPLSSDPDLSVNFKGVAFRNPIIASSGTFGFASEYAEVFDVNALGGISSKGLTIEPREGNSGIRLWETPSGMLNSIGLQNPGIPHFIENELPKMLALSPVAIANLSGSTMESYVEGAKLLDKTQVPVIELNISCPNISAGGAAWGMTCANAAQVVKEIRALTKKPLVVKLTPQSRELEAVVLACVEAGADGISLCNSFQGVAIDVERAVPVFDKIKAGFGGPAVRPIAMRLVWEAYDAMLSLPEEKRVPIFAIGGAQSWRDAAEFIMAGATFVEVGTATFANPPAAVQIIDGLRAFMRRKGYKSILEMRAAAHAG